ncbi:MAG: vitamin K epoxide reductase family protein, partial [Candidatus Binatia bacterium]
MSGASRGSGLLYAMLGALGVGVAIALYLVRLKLKIALDPDYVSSCNYGGAINCDAVNISQWSEFMGVPISLLALPTYFAMAFMVWTAIQSRVPGATRPVRERGDVALKAVASIGLL